MSHHKGGGRGKRNPARSRMGSRYHSWGKRKSRNVTARKKYKNR